MSGKRPVPLPADHFCDECRQQLAARGTLTGYSPVRANSMYCHALVSRDRLDREERGPRAWAYYRNLSRHGIDQSELPSLMVNGEVAPIYEPFDPCGSCQAQLAKFTPTEGSMLFFSAELETRLARFMNPRRGKLSSAARDEMQALTVAAFRPLERTLVPLLHAKSAALQAGMEAL